MDKNHQGPKMKTWKMKMPAGVGVHGQRLIQRMETECKYSFYNKMAK